MVAFATRGCLGFYTTPQRLTAGRRGRHDHLEYRHPKPVPDAGGRRDDAGAEARNAALKDVILERRRLMPSMRASNSGGWHSDRDLLAWGGTAAAEVIEMARAVANHMTRDRSGGEVRPAWIITAWANVNGPGNSNFCHYHPGSFWSGTYYVDTGGDPGSQEHGGEFEMLARGARLRRCWPPPWPSPKKAAGLPERPRASSRGQACCFCSRHGSTVR
jgi:hypothetical protein